MAQVAQHATLLILPATAQLAALMEVPAQHALLASTYPQTLAWPAAQTAQPAPATPPAPSATSTTTW